MKKAVITTGGKQYLVAENQVLEVERIKQDGKTATFEPLLVIDGDKVSIGTPLVSNVKVTAEIVSNDLRADKVTAIRYKAKKRVRKVRGHRQELTQLKITKIA